MRHRFFLWLQRPAYIPSSLQSAFFLPYPIGCEWARGGSNLWRQRRKRPPRAALGGWGLVVRRSRCLITVVVLSIPQRAEPTTMADRPSTSISATTALATREGLSTDQELELTRRGSSSGPDSLLQPRATSAASRRRPRDCFDLRVRVAFRREVPALRECTIESGRCTHAAHPR